MKTHKAYFTYGVSRGRDSQGYRIVSLYIDGVKVAMTIGVGYDQHGTVLGQWLSKTYNTELTKLKANYGSGDDNKGFYGLIHYDKDSGKRLHKSTKKSKTYVDGMCGRSSVAAIARAIGVDWFETRKPRKGKA